ncbi:chromate efflux transporter [Microbacterium sp.]|uniref:chromate efflux transporter n=1 Tax=Microbacterium sp. TaxID=51671 RepID=UPI00289C3D0C|nr:chromate efflux transporter [Microbacterium sp.]
MAQSSTVAARSTVWEVFLVFLKLGTTSFGGPVAHLGYFRAEFVERRKWMDDREYADLVALSQFLPGPASSQVGFGVGLLRAGGWGAIAAFVGFTLPSAILMVGFAYGASWFTGPIGDGLLTGLKIVAVAIVAQAVWGMARTLTPDRPRAGIAVIALATTMLLVGSVGQIAAILLGALGGLIFCRTSVDDRPDMLRFPVRPAVGITSLVVFVVFLIVSPILAAATGNGGVALFDAFYRAGALVFGGGHVVLPLLQAGVVDPGWMTNAEFLAGYGVAQAVPGPLFTFAGYLGAIADTGPGGIWGASIALIAVFLPGFLLLVGVLPFWNTFRRHPWAQAVLRGANAAVVGILAAALYSPVFTTAITGPGPFLLAVVCFVVLVAWKLPPWVVVIIGAGGGVVLTLH